MSKKLYKWIFFILGCICLVLSYIGIVLPGFPGTPFILLTAFFFIRSSTRMYAWIMRRKIFARLINEGSKNQKIPLKFKIYILIPFWISVLVAEIFFTSTIWSRLSVLTLSLLVSYYFLRLKKLNLTSESQNKDLEKSDS
jgi:uncharacterized protein